MRILSTKDDELVPFRVKTILKSKINFLNSSWRIWFVKTPLAFISFQNLKYFQDNLSAISIFIVFVFQTVFDETDCHGCATAAD